MRAAGIDIGTNTIRLIIADIKDSKIDRIIYQDRKITRLGEGIIHTNELDEQAILRTILALKTFKETIDHFFINKYYAVATSAVREAKNGNKFIKLCNEIGLNVDIIDGNEEAKLIYLGVTSSLDIDNKNPLIFDIGGGSTEFILNKDDKINYKSIKLGVVKLADEINFFDIITDEVIEKTNSIIENKLNEIPFLKEADTLIATAGTPTTLAAIDLELEDYDYRKVHGYELTKEEILNIFEKLRSMTSKERKEIKGLEEGREDLIIPGTLIILKIMELTGCEKLIVSDFGLREGIVIHAATVN
ncbi:Ppx/GppA family phosphatase [Deferribacter autotrophicus]|uniref:Ppx/GppA family phosphatase n=1 Tax=Deferribacter autotrophicus TaxID=500465 RepID=A0A5A8F0R5_9BACT|nr:Ppx/GppA phosphatase family protein [Deferribacter autotrophicus]KAA0256907.1 Ppx/GppA family phosphatase [Deferribacter autotrophicus]